MKKKYLLLSAVLCFSMILFAGCGTKNNDADSANNRAVENNDLNADDNTMADDVEEGVDEAVDDAKDAAEDVMDDTRNAVDDAKDTTRDSINDATAGRN